MYSILNEYGKSFLEKLATLTQDKKFIFGLIYISRQSDLVNLFDNRYHTDLNNVFCRYVQYGIDMIAKNKPIPIDINEIYAAIPDSDDYSEVECSYAQNALISIYYLFDFYMTNKNDLFLKSLDMALENVDVISYSANKSYNEEKVFSYEIDVMNNIIYKIENSSDNLYNLMVCENKLSPL